MGLLEKIGSTVNSIAGDLIVLGWQHFNTLGLNNSNFVVISAVGDEFLPVRARIVSMNISSQSSWTNKFENSSIDERMGSVASFLQAGEYAEDLAALKALKGKTLVTKASTVQIWGGEQPMSVSLEVEFNAFTDAVIEVEKPIAMLYKMKSPNLKKNAKEVTKAAADAVAKAVKNQDPSSLPEDIAGEIPPEISLSILTSRFNGTFVIESIQEAIESIQVDNGSNRVYQRVSIELGSKRAITREDIKEVGWLSGLLPKF